MGIAYNTSVVRDGLVLHLDAANVKSYPGSGTTWSDLSGSGNNGTLVNGPIYSSSDNGSIIFDGTNDGVNCGDVDFGPTFSISIWLKGSPTQSSSFCGLSCKDGASNFGAGGLYADGTNSYVRFGFRDVDGTQREVSNASYNDLKSTSWVNYVGTYNQSSLRLFRNTIQIATGAYTQTPASTADPYAIAYRPTSGGYNFEGSVGATTVYNRALSETEIRQNYEALRGRYGL